MNYKELEEKLERCKNIKLVDVDPKDIDDISKIKIDKRKSSNDRILDFLNTTKNPYIFKCNGKFVKIEFSKCNLTASECLSNAVSSVYK